MQQQVEARLTIFKTYVDAVDQLSRGAADIVFVDAAFYASAGQHFILLGTDNKFHGTYLKWAIVVDSRTSISELSELKNGRFAFGGLMSSSAQSLARSKLVGGGLTVSDLQRVTSYVEDACIIRAIADGAYQAGSVRMSTLNSTRGHASIVRVLCTFDDYAHVWVGRSDLDSSLIGSLRESFRPIEQLPRSEELLHTAMPNAADVEYETLREAVNAAVRFEQDKL